MINFIPCRAKLDHDKTHTFVLLLYLSRHGVNNKKYEGDCLVKGVVHVELQMQFNLLSEKEIAFRSIVQLFVAALILTVVRQV